MLTIYHYPKCSTCKKAIAFLVESGLPFEAVDLVEQPPTKERLLRIMEAIGGNAKKLLNTSGILYREMKIAERAPTLSNEEIAELLASHGKLIKRPIVLGLQRPLIGFKDEEWRVAFSANPLT